MPTRADVLARTAAATETAEQRAARQVAAAYNQARRELLATLLEGWTGSSVMTPDDAARLLRQSGLLQQIDARLLQLEREVGITLRGIVTDSTERALDGIRRELALLPPALRPNELDMFGTINSKMIEQFVPVAMSDWHGLTVGMSTTLQRELQTGLIQGESFPVLSTRLLRQAPGEGPGAVFPRAQTSADLATRRLVIAAENGAKQAAIAEVAAVIPQIQKQAMAAIGKNTTDCCLRAHGQIVDNDKPFQLVGEPRFADELMTSPFHWNCRTGIAMYHPFFEAAMPTAKLKADAQKELKRREEKSGKGKRAGDDGKPIDKSVPTLAKGDKSGDRPIPPPPVAPALDRDDPAQVRQEIIRTDQRYASQLADINAKIAQKRAETAGLSQQLDNIALDVASRGGATTTETEKTLKALRDQRSSAWDERVVLQRQLKDAEREREGAAMLLLKVRDPATTTLNAPGQSDQTTARWQKGVDDFNLLVSGSVAPARPVNFTDVTGRASYNPQSRTVRLRTDNGSDVVVHEMGHWLEHHNPDVLRKALEFHDRRTAGETTAPLYEGVPGEVGKKDRYPDVYVGREYTAADGRRFASEIVSMGIQYFQERPAYFANKDPEYFDFIFNLVRGR